MPRFYIQEYTRGLAGKTVCVAIREGILRGFFGAVVSDIKFLNRQGIKTVLYHNIPNRLANQKYFRELDDRLPETRIVRLPPEIDIYNYVLDHEEKMHKLIFLERKPLVDQEGRKINAVTTQAVRQSINTWGELIANINFKGALEKICAQIDAGHYERVHIVPAGRHALKYELFTIEGHGSLIANNFVERFEPITADEDVRLINGILNLYKRQGFLKPRTEAYILEHRDNFFVTLIDEIVVGCVEKRIIDPATVEIAALAISTKFLNQRVGLFTVQAFMDRMKHEGFTRVISLTNNPKLIQLYGALGFVPCHRPEYQSRQADSPNVPMFFIKVE
ncbi:MAG: GNAT family N-acetyltransferase [Desulfobacteraceae bacterium]